jgi:hypothetical protein
VIWYNALNGASGVCDGTSNWTAQVVLASGNNEIIVTVIDGNGMMVQRSIFLILDADAPSVIITIPDAGEYVTSSVTVIWNAEDNNSGISTIKIRLDDGRWTYVSGTASFTFDSVSEGAHIVYLIVTDNAGNRKEVSVSFIVDDTAPTVEITSPADGYRNNTGSLTVAWAGSDSMSGIAYYTVSIDGIRWSTVSGTSYTFSGLDEGEHTVFVRAYDGAGNYAEDSITVVIDSTAPSALVSPMGLGVSVDSVITVEFSEAMDQAMTTITIEGVTGTITWNGNIATFTPSSLDYNGAYIVNVVGRDLAGNAFAKSWTFNTTVAGNIAGILVDEDGDPIAGANVTLSNGMMTTSDANGRFVFNDVPLGAYNVTIVAEGHESIGTNATSVAGTTDELGELTMISTEDDSDSSVLMFIVIIVVIAAIIAVVVLFLKRRP